ncbi:MAG: TonB-dependent receptor [Phenylobacterium sp.]|uniref:TonB-dependent receptor domain-containing protein n=1 Tax=Phenylobacterium sp. TaxID=1871053 RepID=UPI0011F66737|nr:TonB-dependent receptor [Phenylobacterium sp.]TAL36239.1 MAG: TonB-dependent receptor [Phenylobacterium sp.]
MALACGAGRVEAADARYRFTIPPRSYADALIDLGLQANVSVLGTASCGTGGRAALTGRYTLDQALEQLLAGAPCRYRIVDARTVRISPAAPPPQALPERDPSRPPSIVAEVVVTATKRPVALGRLPAGVSAISRDQIGATRANDVGQTVGQLAGVLTTNLGPGRDKLLIRGLSDGAFTGRTRSTVGTYLDDAPVNYNAPDPDLRLVDIDRIEVVRGPQGALYGSGAIAGVYRIVTTKPDLKDFEFGGSATVSRTEGGDESHEFDGYLGIPLVKDHIALRLVAYEEVQGGYLDDVNLQVRNVDQTRRDGGRLALRIRFNDSWRLDAHAAMQNLRSDDTRYVTSAMSAPGAPSARRSQIRETHNNDFSYAGVTTHGEFDWGSVTSSTNYVRHVFSSQFDATVGLRELPTANLTDLGAYVEATRSNIVVQDLVVRSSDSGRFNWLVGANAARTVDRTPSRLDALGSLGAATAYAEDRKDRLAEDALYGEATYDLGSGWSVTAGGRLFQTRVHTTAAVVVTFSGERAFDRKDSFDGFSPKLSVQREFDNGDLIYGLISEGYRPGGFNSSGFFPIRAERAVFAPDRLRNFETGVKLRRMEGRLAVRAAAYYSDWSNVQTDQYRASGLRFTSNVGDARIMGLEGELSYEWRWGLTVAFNGLVSNSFVRNFNPDFASRVANNLPGVPDTSGGILAVYERALNDRFSLRLVGEASYVGRSRISFDAASAARTDNYLRSKLAAEVSADHWRLTAFVTNPFDYDADTFAYGNPFSFSGPRGVRQATPQRPRTLGLRLATTF